MSGDSNRKNVDDGELIICRCEEVTKQEIVDAIYEGYTTIQSIRKRTRAGMGFCQGKTCGRLLQQLIVEYADVNAKDTAPARVRPPVRPLAIDVFTKGADEI